MTSRQPPSSPPGPLAQPSLDPSQLRSLFRALTHAALATCAVGCGLELPPEPTPEPEPEWDAVTCGPQGEAVLERALHGAAAQVAFAGIYQQSLFVGIGERVQPPWVSDQVRHGEPCAGVSDPDVCAAEYARLRTPTDCTTGPCPPFVIARTGEGLARLDTRDELLAMLGSIETTSEAILLAAFDGHPVKCRPGLSSEPIFQPTRARSEGTGFVVDTTHEECGNGIFHEVSGVTREGTYTELEKVQLDESLCAIGRKPAGLCESSAPGQESAVAAYLAKAAELEAASVHAFRQLTRELIALAAPEALIAAAGEALLDELRHARDVARLARSFGSTVHPPRVNEVPLRGAYEIALDNAREGCVRETFGALLATYQAETARTPEVRSVMRAIAEDETRHAQLSWRLAAWLEPQLSERERREISAARAQALSELHGELDLGLSVEASRALGYPAPAVARELLTGLTPALAALAA